MQKDTTQKNTDKNDTTQNESKSGGPLTIQSKLKLSDGNEIPLFGLGVYQAAAGAECKKAVRTALSLGYRHIDTAAIYGNEKDVGQAILESEIARKEIFVTTKLWNSDQGFDSALKACAKSLKTLGLEYIDLYLIHWPVAKLRSESWRALVKLKDEGLCRSIGVSNFTVRHLMELFEMNPVKPSVNQVEFSPFLYQKELLGFCQEQGVALEAYSPLTKGEKLAHPTLGEIARKHGRTAAQILIRWCLEHGVIVIPKSARVERIAENAGVFDFALDKQDMLALDSLNEDYRTSWDPTHLD